MCKLSFSYYLDSKLKRFYIYRSESEDGETEEEDSEELEKEAVEEEDDEADVNNVLDCSSQKQNMRTRKDRKKRVDKSSQEAIKRRVFREEQREKLRQHDRHAKKQIRAQRNCRARREVKEDGFW